MSNLRRVVKVVEGRETSDGAGVRLKRSLGMPALDYLDPFLLLDEFKSDDVSSTNVAVNYAFKFGVRGTPVSLFIQPEILNLFNQDAVIFPDATVLDATSSAAFQPFNPFTTTPVEGVNFGRGPNFGTALSSTDFQRPRIFRVSVGFRF